MFGFQIGVLKLVKRTSSGYLATIWAVTGNRGNRWLNAVFIVYLTSSDQVRLGQRPFHIHLVSYSKTSNELLTDRVFLPQNLLVFLHNVENNFYVSNMQKKETNVIAKFDMLTFYLGNLCKH